MKKRIFRTLAMCAALVFVLGFAPTAVFADEGSDSGNQSSTGTSSNDDTKSDTEDDHGGLRERLQELKQERQDNKQHRLEANKLRSCEQRATKVKAIMSRSITRAERQLELFDTIAGRVKAFYADKGRTVASYDEVVAAVEAAKTKAQTDFDTLKTLEAFDCNADDPKGDVEAFKLALKSINQDLKDYRTAVKNLIVAVKSAQGTASRQEDGGEQ